ncbi:HAD family phosphatase [Thalassobius sp. Cn5-15]|uniref:HAD family hydrolase n=1 Tax=Thalassobius sp. Cn5-15 TaxID=2917763 RepID=UPI001EF2F58E|nr:HAD family phosphatase [Thalassobius sp. Cn5-15]MCG7492665.1 HAD family phosphatase [Thalassobius sp. Cn5-15]
MPDAYLFDMDGLLLDTERLGMACFVDVMTTLGVAAHVSEPFGLTMIGTAAPEGRRLLAGFLPADITVAEVEDRWTAAFDLATQAGVPVKPGVADLLSDLAGQGARMAVVTSTSGDRARHHLERADLLRHMDFVIGGYEVPTPKPDPAPYLMAADRLAVDPTRAAAFEDSDRGIAAAVAAGCHAVQVPDLRPAGKPLPALGQMVATTLAEAVAQAQASAVRGRMG